METLKFILSLVATLILTAAFIWAVAKDHYYKMVSDMEAKTFAAETQLKIEKEYSKIMEKLKQGIIDNQNEKLHAMNIELPRKFAHIEQLCKEGKAKDEEIYLLKEEKKHLQAKLDHYRPVQGEKGRFIKKSLQTI